MLDRLHNRGLRIGGILLLTLLSVSSTGYLRPPITQIGLIKIAIALVFMTVIWEMNRLWIGVFLKRFPHRSQVIKRLA
ncbi:hypothetical protein ACS5NO_16965 [Larkinella sp. GY13]|uniref:hypothetical protein n=1 Tax=Larkinella sp. GY13 TaxID=3453720 RepID=UPI003EEEC33F